MLEQEVTVAALLAATLVSFLAYIVLVGLRATTVDWAVALLRLVAKYTPSIPWVGNPFDLAASAIEDTLGYVLGAAANACEGAAVFYWHGLAWVVRMAIDDIHWFAHETWWGFHQLRHAVIPGLIHDATHPLSQLYKGIDHLVNHIRHALEAQIARGIDRIGRLEHTLVHGIEGKFRAADRTLEGTITGEYHRFGHALIRPLDRLIAEIKARLHRLERSLTRTEVGAIAIAAVATEWGFLRCTNFKNLGKRTCHIPVQFLEQLLSAAIDALTVIEICKIARGCQVLAKDALPLIEELVLVENAVCLAGGETFPSAYVQPVRLSKATLASAIELG